MHDSHITPKIVDYDIDKVKLVRFSHYESWEDNYGSYETIASAIKEFENEPNGALLLPESDLRQGLLGWPSKKISSSSSVESRFGTRPFKQLQAGHRAIEFTLLDTKGVSVSLASLLDTKPVVLTSAQNSCPHFQSTISAMNDIVRRCGHVAHFICVNTMQPFPAHPDPSPETGKVWETRFSRETGPQPVSYQARLNLACQVQKKLPNWTVLVDDIPSTDRDRTNPWWSTYGPASRATYVIDRCGLIFTSQLWFDEGVISDELHKLPNLDWESEVVDNRGSSFLGQISESIKKRTPSFSKGQQTFQRTDSEISAGSMTPI